MIEIFIWILIIYEKAIFITYKDISIKNILIKNLSTSLHKKIPIKIDTTNIYPNTKIGTTTNNKTIDIIEK